MSVRPPKLNSFPVADSAGFAGAGGGCSFGLALLPNPNPKNPGSCLVASSCVVVVGLVGACTGCSCLMGCFCGGVCGVTGCSVDLVIGDDCLLSAAAVGEAGLAGTAGEDCLLLGEPASASSFVNGEGGAGASFSFGDPGVGACLVFGEPGLGGNAGLDGLLP